MSWLRSSAPRAPAPLRADHTRRLPLANSMVGLIGDLIVPLVAVMAKLEAGPIAARLAIGRVPRREPPGLAVHPVPGRQHGISPAAKPRVLFRDGRDKRELLHARDRRQVKA